MRYSTLLLVTLGLVAADGAVKWTVKNADGKTCLIFAADTINAKLNAFNPELNATEPISFSILNATRVSGRCDDNYSGVPANSLEVTFFPNGETPAHATDAQPWRLILWFTQAETVAFKLTDYVLEIAPSPFNTTTQNFTKSATADLDVQATQKNGFKCSTSGLALSEESSIDLKNARIIANALIDGDDFPEGQTFEQCLLDTRTSDIVPIVVGACLAGLVVVVLVAYLVGRARAKRQGYASV